MKILTVFIILSFVNVVFSTIRSIVTIKGDKLVASLVSGAYFAFYNVMLVYTVMDFPMWQKCVITFVCNIFGVWIVKFIEQKMKKDKLWVFNATFKNTRANGQVQNAIKMFESVGIKFIYVPVVPDVLYTMQIFSYSQKESEMITSILKNFDVKYYITESK